MINTPRIRLSIKPCCNWCGRAMDWLAVAGFPLSLTRPLR
jgi:hypothetical protein